MPNGIDNFGTLLGQTQSDLTNTQQTQSITKDPGPTQFAFGNYDLNIVNTKILIEQQNVGNAFILGSSTNGILGTSVLGALNMIWGNSGSIWGTVSWGGTLAAYSTVYSSSVNQPLTNLSKTDINNWFIGNSITQPSYVAIGIGTTAYLPTQTTLVDEQYRTSFDTYDTTTDTILNAQLNLNSTQTSLQGIPFTEIGSFNDPTSGTMFSRYVFPEITFNNTSNYRFTIQTTILDNSPFGGIATTSGLNAMRDWLGNETINPPNYIAWGNGTTTLVKTDTTLEGEFQRNIMTGRNIVSNTIVDTSLLTYSQPAIYVFSVSGITISPTVGSVYTNNGEDFTIISTSLTGVAPNILGTIVCTYTGSPLASGDLTFSSGVGDATIAFSAYTPNIYLTKSGLFDTASTGTIWFEQTWPTILKTNNFQMSETDQITIS
jgi:hypothetical protein